MKSQADRCDLAISSRKTWMETNERMFRAGRLRGDARRARRSAWMACPPRPFKKRLNWRLFDDRAEGRQHHAAEDMVIDHGGHQVDAHPAGSIEQIAHQRFQGGFENAHVQTDDQPQNDIEQEHQNEKGQGAFQIGRCDGGQKGGAGHPAEAFDHGFRLDAADDT
ncbi:hypothetical protein DESC_700063 [Desulfosarcina cetonica]|nr:hypothetical protein DESC_700063 [Desulfosarcina cetonica]